ncbi:hypothetical protein EB796_021566 [Bugula neritina]|uniref:Uncharacterized protein n=1 Tax=Bugula neritina TaxID=10212 RepID=A0A7J7J365_BUGNE|nr:hypothetical protein EB796_021566 [Bugula neritina]
MLAVSRFPFFTTFAMFTTTISYPVEFILSVRFSFFFPVVVVSRTSCSVGSVQCDNFLTQGTLFMSVSIPMFCKCYCNCLWINIY